MIIAVTIYFSIILLVSILGLKKRQTKQTIDHEKQHALSVIIPFKNEAENIRPLITALNRANLPEYIEFIFIDDHSDDDTVSLILSTLDLKYRLVRLRTTTGKKQAIKYGVQLAQYKYVLTLDADVDFGPNFFNAIVSLPVADLTILPVNMTSKRLFQHLNAIEFKWLQTLTFLSARFNAPILCNGANLKFNRNQFKAVEPLRRDAHLLSGDDVFLLQAIQYSEGYINAFNNKMLEVNTPAPSTIGQLLNQRIRWISKLNHFSSYVGILILIFSNLLLLLACYHLPSNWIWLFPILLKIMGEWLGTNHLNIQQLFLIVLHQIYYPIYGMALICYWPFKRKW